MDHNPNNAQEEIKMSFTITKETYDIVEACFNPKGLTRPQDNSLENLKAYFDALFAKYERKPHILNAMFKVLEGDFTAVKQLGPSGMYHPILCALLPKLNSNYNNKWDIQLIGNTSLEEAEHYIWVIEVTELMNPLDAYENLYKLLYLRDKERLTFKEMDKFQDRFFKKCVSYYLAKLHARVHT